MKLVTDCDDSKFPIIIELVDAGTHMIVDSPDELPSSIGFKVIETNVKWVPHMRNSWPYEYGELLHDVEFDVYSSGGKKMRNRTVLKGTTVRIVMVSRFGDVGITDKLSEQHGYGARNIPVDKLDEHLANLRKTL